MVTSQVQTGSFGITTETTKSVLISAVVLARTMVQFTVRTGNDDRMNKWGFTVEFSDTTHILFTRTSNANDNPSTIEWVVTEFAAGVANVQAGIVDPSSTSTDVTITSLDTTKSFPLGFANTTSAAGATTTTVWEAKLTAATTLNISFSTAPSAGGCKISWQTVEFPTGCSVQSGEKLYGHPDGSATQAITSVNTAKTLVFSTRQINYGSDGLGRTSVRTVLTDATTITFSNGITAGTSGSLVNAWFAVAFTDGTSVQQGIYTVAALATTTDTAITAVVLARSQVWNHFSWQNFKTAATGTGEGNCVQTYKLTTTTNHQGQRTQSATAVDVAWSLVQWEAAGTAKKHQVPAFLFSGNRGFM